MNASISVDKHLSTKPKEFRTTGIDARVVHPLASNSRSFQRNHKQADSTFARSSSPDSSRAVIGPDAVGDPFLRSIHNVVIPLSRHSGLDICNIRPSCT